MDNPIFITGVYRSGSTYLSRILNAHPELNITYDSVNYFRYHIKKNNNPKDFETIVDEVIDRLKIRYGIVLTKSKIIQQIKSHPGIIDHKVIYIAIMNEFWNHNNNRWGEKTLLEWRNIPVFLSMFPDGQAVHIVRDVRDTLASYKNMTIEEKDRYLDAIFCSVDSYDFALKYSNILPKNKYYLLIYESLIEDPENEIKKLCKFLNIKYTDKMLEQSKFKDLFGKKFNLVTHTSFPDDKTPPIKRWKSKLDKNEILFAEAIAGDRMSKLGYELSVKKCENPFTWLIEKTTNTPLIKERLIRFLHFNEGVEEYPSDPTNPENWGGDTGIQGQGAKKAYGKQD